MDATNGRNQRHETKHRPPDSCAGNIGAGGGNSAFNDCVLHVTADPTD